MTPQNNPKNKNKKKNVQQEVLSSPSSTSSDEEPPPPPKKASKKKNPLLELAEEDLGGPLAPSDVAHCSSSELPQATETSAKRRSKRKKSKN